MASPASRRPLTWSLAVLGWVPLATSCAAPRFAIPEPVTRQGEDIMRLWKGSVIAALCVGALIWALVGYSVIRYRRRNDDLPSQKAHNIPLEVVYTVIPLLIVAVLFAFTVATQRRVTALKADPDLVVEVVGFQWQWQFHYPDENVTVTGTPDRQATLMLPVDSTVRLVLDSPDVVHSFWVPRFLEKRDLIPGIKNEIDVDVTRPGTWVGRCAEFCGLDHYRMNFSVQAVPEAEFRRWIQERQAVPEP